MMNNIKILVIKDYIKIISNEENYKILSNCCKLNLNYFNQIFIFEDNNLIVKSYLESVQNVNLIMKKLIECVSICDENFDNILI